MLGSLPKSKCLLGQLLAFFEPTVQQCSHPFPLCRVPEINKLSQLFCQPRVCRDLCIQRCDIASLY
jgi:hypothetical protein